MRMFADDTGTRVAIRPATPQQARRGLYEIDLASPPGGFSIIVDHETAADLVMGLLGETIRRIAADILNPPQWRTLAFFGADGRSWLAPEVREIASIGLGIPGEGQGGRDRIAQAPDIVQAELDEANLPLGLVEQDQARVAGTLLQVEGIAEGLDRRFHVGPLCAESAADPAASTGPQEGETP